MSLAEINRLCKRNYYIGQEITVNGVRAVITGAGKDHIRVRFDGSRVPTEIHPTWRIKEVETAD